MEKRANPFITAPALHVAQNIAAKSQLANPKLHKTLLRAFLAKAQTGNKVFGAKGAILPELAIGEKEFMHAGKRFSEELTNAGLDVNKLTNRDIVTIKRLLRGDIRQAMNGQSKNKKELFSAVMKAISPQAGDVSRLLAEKGDVPLAQLEELWKANPISNDLISGISEQIGKVKDLSAPTLREQRARQAVMAGVTGAIALIDPATAAVNVGKHALGNEWIRKFRPMAYAQDAMNKVFVKDPMERAFRRGVAGDKAAINGLDNFVMDYAMNPVVNQTTNLVKGIGNIAHKNGITMQQIDDVASGVKKSVSEIKQDGFENFINNKATDTIGNVVANSGITKEQINAAAPLFMTAAGQLKNKGIIGAIA